jgi:hypothetical protein
VLSQPLMGRTSLALSESNPNVVYALASYYRAGDALNYKMRAVYRSADSGATWEERVSYTDPNKLNTVQLTNPVYAFWPIAVRQREPVLQPGLVRQPDRGRPARRERRMDGRHRPDALGRRRPQLGVASYWWFDPGDPNYAHADNHAITFHPKYNGSNNRQLFVASDGGVHRTTTRARPWARPRPRCAGSRSRTR